MSGVDEPDADRWAADTLFPRDPASAMAASVMEPTEPDPIREAHKRAHGLTPDSALWDDPRWGDEWDIDTEPFARWRAALEEIRDAPTPTHDAYNAFARLRHIARQALGG